MPNRSTTSIGESPVRIGVQPDGSGGLGSLGVDMQSHARAVPEFGLTRGERVRFMRGALERAPGCQRLAILTNNTASRTFGADSKYMKVTAASQLLIPKGSWGLRISFTAVRSASTGYILSNRQTGQTYGVVWLTLSSTGVLEANVRWASGTTTTLTTTALGAGSTQHGLLVYDTIAGTLTIYLNGTAADSESPGPGLQVSQAAVDWYFGVEWNPSTPGVTANTHFDGAIDAFTLFKFTGVRITAGSPSLLDTMRAETFREWPAPDDPKVLAHYDFNEASGTVAYDRSRFSNHGAYVGGPTSTAAVALSYPVGNAVGCFQKASGARVNYVAAGGQFFSEPIRAGV